MDLELQWIVGFVDGEGCFHVAINKNAKTTLGIQVQPELTVVQHERDIQVLYALKEYFGCGVVRRNHGDRLAFRVRGQKNLRTKIVPFFEKHKLKTKKRVDFEKFRAVVLLIEQGYHLTEEGIERIQKIQAGMNRKTKSKPYNVHVVTPNGNLR
jgi:hypothetical protein